MPRSTLRSILLLVLAVLPLAASAAGAQTGRDVIRARDLRDSGAERLYDAIAQMRPDWLPADSTGGAGPRVLVFLNGRHAGDTRVLRGIPTGEVVQARVRTSEYVRRTDPRFPREEFDLAIYVSTRAVARSKPTGRLTISIEPGFNIRSSAAVVDDAFAEAGYDTKILRTENGVSVFFEEGTTMPPSLGGTIHYGVTGPWGVALTGQHTWKGWAAGYSHETNFAVSAFLTSSEGAVLATREAGTFRAGVGPAYRQMSLDWTSGFCQCVTPVTSSESSFGLAAEGLVMLPLSGRVYPSLRVLARYFPSQEMEYERLEEPLQVGGFAVTMGLSLATRF